MIEVFFLGCSFKDHRMKKITLAAVAALAIAGCTQQGGSGGTAPSAGMASGTTALTPTSAPSFVQMAASSGMYEVMSSQLAMNNSPQLRTAAQQIIQDHDRANRELMSIAAANNMEVPQRLMDRHRSMLDQLQAAGTGPSFDRMYVQQQKMAHEEAITLFSSYTQNGSNPQLKAFATRTLPVLQMHQQMLQSMSM
jgi:putative membrane protein